MKISVIQDGARRHYAVPRALALSGLLQGMYSPGVIRSTIMSRGIGMLGRITGISELSSISKRHPVGIPVELVYSNWFLQYKLYKLKRDIADPFNFYELESRLIAEWLLGENSFNRSEVVYGYIRSVCPDLVRKVSERGADFVGDQIIAPACEELKQLELQHERWPGFELLDGVDELKKYDEWESQTFQHCRRIVCGSAYVAHHLSTMGYSNVSVVRTPSSLLTVGAGDRQSEGLLGPFRVGFVGSVGLRKGAPYYFELARRFNPKDVVFEMIGPVKLTPRGQKEAGEVQLLGRCTRSEIIGALAKLDVFVFPSTCEGSANAVIEAMSAGIPVICSPNSGSPIRDEHDGFIVDYDDVNGMESRLRQLLDDDRLRQEMGERARETAKKLSLEAYSLELKNALGSIRI